ncbi:CobW family GTP-binding protein [Paracoccus tibetensis]|uniref:GTPase, G3E family n=1 Tax=Paracoccus tibetensis TaxID=336292 RepID=A0A1G5HMT8_9RHOB|nr:GTP-binding protein [Paracoccus tibetensis]SCY65057.1 GTPase, G3E family [Paracoccus tibetensis]
MADRIPVTLLTGFLGAGKTTLLNRLLHDPSAGRIAVIVNEFGEAGLDHDLIENVAEDVVLMESGCICCTIRNDLSRTLAELHDRLDAETLTFDRVVIETTGLADPGPIHHTLMLDARIARSFRLDGIVTAVDAALGASTLDRHAEAQAQVAMADRIVLTKCDLVSPMDRAALERRLDALNPQAARLQADRGALPPGCLFDLSTGRSSGNGLAALEWVGEVADPLAGLSGFKAPSPASPASPAPAALAGFPSTAPHHARENNIATASITIDRPIPAPVFDFWMDMLLGTQGQSILRLKAIVHIEDAPCPFVLHGVQHMLEAPVPLKDWPKDDQTSRVVLIARDLSAEALAGTLELLRLRPGGTGREPDLEVEVSQQVPER